MYIEETVRVKEEIIEKDTSIAGMSASATEITESLDKMLEDFEKEEEEERNEEIKEGALSIQEDILIENCNETLDKTEDNDIVADKSNKTMDKTVEVKSCKNGEKGPENSVGKKIDKVLEACEAEYLNNKVEDELLGDEGKNQYEKTMFIVKNSKIVGRLKTVRKVEHLIVDANPFQHKSTESVFDKYSRFWEVIGLVP